MKLIKGIYEESTVNITSGERLNAFILGSGIRQRFLSF